jgi:hypothetical protein
MTGSYCRSLWPTGGRSSSGTAGYELVHDGQGLGHCPVNFLAPYIRSTDRNVRRWDDTIVSRLKVATIRARAPSVPDEY